MYVNSRSVCNMQLQEDCGKPDIEVDTSRVAAPDWGLSRNLKQCVLCSRTEYSGQRHSAS